MYANFVSASIIMTKTEAKAAGKVNSNEFNELAALRAAYPNFRIVIRTSKSKDSMKGLDTNYMERYIKAHDDAENTILKEFYALRGLDENGTKKELAQAVSYGELKMWFLATYPEVEKMNETVNAILEKAKAKRMAAKQAA